MLEIERHFSLKLQCFAIFIAVSMENKITLFCFDTNSLTQMSCF